MRKKYLIRQIILNGEEITSAYNYANFINRVYNFDKRLSPVKPREFTDMLLAEKDSIIVKNFEKQFQLVKTRINKALELLDKQELSENEDKWLQILLSSNAQAKTSTDIIKIIERSLELTDRFK